MNILNPQRGMALLVVLVFMLLLAMLGLYAVQDSVLQEKMAGNSRNRSLAFEAAETALHHGERDYLQWKDQNFATERNTCSGGLCDAAATAPNDAAYWQDDTRWQAGNSLSLPEDAPLPHLAAQPRYRIERLLASNGQPDGRYRITASATGGEGKARVVLQALFEPCIEGSSC
ncbi:hypothetical protein EGI20_07405 [Aquitalea sp. S1-19]|nr:hypothetical protein [Aquitalea sp. S1-19]